MSLNRIRTGLLIILSQVAAGRVSAQMFTDQGVMSGSGLVMLPTATVAPSSEMEFQYSRLGFMQDGSSRVNIFSLNSGFSTSVEGYVRLTSEELRTVSSQISYSFGAKFRYPGDLPVVRRLAFWGESTFSDMENQTKPALFPTQATRWGAAVSVDSNGFRPTFFAGGFEHQGVITAMAGAGLTVALGHRGQLALEYMYGYFGPSTDHGAVTTSLRILPDISLHLSPGYITAGALRSWMFSAGISFSTTDIDYHQIKEPGSVKDEFSLPSLDDLEHQTKEEKQ